MICSRYHASPVAENGLGMQHGVHPGRLRLRFPGVFPRAPNRHAISYSAQHRGQDCGGRRAAGGKKGMGRSGAGRVACDEIAKQFRITLFFLEGDKLSREIWGAIMPADHLFRAL